MSKMQHCFWSLLCINFILRNLLKCNFWTLSYVKTAEDVQWSLCKEGKSYIVTLGQVLWYSASDWISTITFEEAITMTLSALAEPFSANQDAHRREWGSQWEGVFSKDLYFELPEQDHEAFEVSVIWNITAILNIYIYIPKHQNLQPWDLVALPEQYMLFSKKLFCSFLAPRVSPVLAPSSTRLHSCHPPTPFDGEMDVDPSPGLSGYLIHSLFPLLRKSPL